MKNLLLALSLSLGIVACGDESIGSPDLTELDTDRDVSDVDIENPDVDVVEDSDVVEDTDTDTDVVEDVVDIDSEGSDAVACSDLDDDGICDDDDNCIDVVNTYQADSDSDGVGDACETCETFEVELVLMGDESYAITGVSDAYCALSSDCPEGIVLERFEDRDGLTIYRTVYRYECTLICTTDGIDCLP